MHRGFFLLYRSLSLICIYNENLIVNCTKDAKETLPLGAGPKIVSWAEITLTANTGLVSLQARSHAANSIFQAGTTIIVT